MVDGADYARVLEVNDKADYLGFIILPPGTRTRTVIETGSLDEVFKVKISELRYPTVPNLIVHEGNFHSVDLFISGAYLVHESLTQLGVIDDERILSAAQQFILLKQIRGK